MVDSVQSWTSNMSNAHSTLVVLMTSALLTRGKIYPKLINYTQGLCALDASRLEREVMGMSSLQIIVTIFHPINTWY